MELFRQHLQGLAQQGDALGMNGHFTRLGAEHQTGNAQHIAQVILLKGSIGCFAYVVTLHINLNVAFAIQQVRKGSLAHNPAAGHTTGDGNHLTFQRIKVVDHVGGMMGYIEFRNQVRILTGIQQTLQLLPADNFLLSQRRSKGGYGIISHGGRLLVLSGECQ